VRELRSEGAEEGNCHTLPFSLMGKSGGSELEYYIKKGEGV
jgi:hypothetical protein